MGIGVSAKQSRFKFAAEKTNTAIEISVIDQMRERWSKFINEVRLWVLGFFSSIDWSIKRLRHIPLVRMAIIASVTQAKIWNRGRPPSARNKPKYANGSANIECSNLMSSRNALTFWNILFVHHSRHCERSEAISEIASSRRLRRQSSQWRIIWRIRIRSNV